MSFLPASLAPVLTVSFPRRAHRLNPHRFSEEPVFGELLILFENQQFVLREDAA